MHTVNNGKLYFCYALYDDLLKVQEMSISSVNLLIKQNMLDGAGALGT